MSVSTIFMCAWVKSMRKVSRRPDAKKAQTHHTFYRVPTNDQISVLPGPESGLVLLIGIGTVNGIFSL